jgi:hypothetical protein
MCKIIKDKMIKCKWYGIKEEMREKIRKKKKERIKDIK